MPVAARAAAVISPAISHKLEPNGYVRVPCKTSLQCGGEAGRKV